MLSSIRKVRSLKNQITLLQRSIDYPAKNTIQLVMVMGLSGVQFGL